MLASRLSRRKLQYQVQWRGWDPDPEYYNAENFKNSTAKLRQFHELNPDAAGLPKRLVTWEKAALEDRFDPSHPEDNTPDTMRTHPRRVGRRRRA